MFIIHRYRLLSRISGFLDRTEVGLGVGEKVKCHYVLREITRMPFSNCALLGVCIRSGLRVGIWIYNNSFFFAKRIYNNSAKWRLNESKLFSTCPTCLIGFFFLTNLFFSFSCFTHSVLNY